MKKIVLSTFSVCVLITAFAQTKPATKPKPTTPAPAAPAAIKSSVDSFSYAIGMSTAMFFKEKGITQVNNAMILKAFDDVLKKNKTVLTPDQMNECIVTKMQKIEADNTSVTRKEGTAFLAANKSKPGVVQLPSGLQYLVVKEGTGPKPGPHDKVKVHYHGTLINGTVFDSSVERGEPIELTVDGVIPGWTEALQLMPVGSKWKLFIPADLAYGNRDAGPIKGGSTLIFDVELLDIVTNAPAAADSTVAPQQ